MPIMPAWSIDDCVREAKRCAAMGYRGVNMTSDPQDSGSPDLGSPEWDPFWDACEQLQLPVHFHIGASQTSLSYFGTTYWPSQDDYVKPAIGAPRCSRTTRGSCSTARTRGCSTVTPA
jgi:predicted TIM-barrel fold metal-dependent hydrolase